jgi:hypothetical protein
MLTEQIPAQELLSASCKEAKPPAFRVRKESQSKAEVDFILLHLLLFLASRISDYIYRYILLTSIDYS